jgi:hypothetical protein
MHTVDDIGQEVAPRSNKSWATATEGKMDALVEKSSKGIAD